MAKAPRPGAKRKTDAIDRAEKLHLVVRLGDTTHQVWPTELSALDAIDLRRQTGYGIHQLVKAFLDPEVRDLPELAAVIWLSRRKTEPGLMFETVASELTTDVITEANEAAEEAEDAPEEVDEPGEA
jgi:hypothetical protein